MSTGTLRCTGPGRPENACRSARRRCPGMLSAVVTIAEYFVTGANIETMSMPSRDVSCAAPLPSAWLAAWPVMTSIGTPSEKAHATPVIRFVAPGPDVPAQTASARPTRAYPSAMNAAPSSCLLTTRRRSSSSSTASKSGWSSPPGIPNTTRTLSAFR